MIIVAESFTSVCVGKQEEKMSNEYLTLTEAAFRNHSSRPNIFKAIKNKKLKAEMVRGKYKISQDDLEEYKENKWSRSKAQMPNGKYVFDKSLHEYSVAEAAKMLRVSTFHIYYAIRTGRIPYVEKGGYKVLKEKDILSYRDLPYLAVKTGSC